MRSARPAGSYDNESHLNKRQLQKRSSNAREGERQKIGERERRTEGAFGGGRQTVDSRRAGEKGRECAASPFLPPQKHTHAHTPGVEGEKGREGNAESSMDHQDPHPHGDVSRAGVAWTVGERQGNVRGVGVLYQAGARGGELSSSKRSVSVT